MAILPILTLLQAIRQDLKYGLRQLWSQPGFTVVAVATLALGIGVNTSIFSLLNALLLRPLAVQDSGGVIGVYRGEDRPCSWSDFVYFQQRSTAFSGLAADATNESALDISDTSEVILAEAVSYNYATVLEIKPLLGRWFTHEDERTTDFPAVISYRTWQSRLSGDAQVIGKQVRLESQWYTVVGVAPKDFQGMASPVLTGIWIPLPRYAQHNQFAARVLKSRDDDRVLMFGRLTPGVSGSQAQIELNTVDAQLRHDYPRAEKREAPLHIEPASGTPDPGYRRMVAPLLMLLSAVVALVLLISCANVANLLLGRGVARRREISIRLALGANRGRISRQMLVEHLLLSLIGAAIGLAAALGANRFLERSLLSAPTPISLGTTLSLDVRVLAFVLIASIVTTLLFGAIPAWQVSRPNLLSALKGNEASFRNRRLTLRNVSVVTQVTLSFVLLIVAGLFLRALQTAIKIDPGYDAQKLLAARLYVAGPEVDRTAGLVLYRRVVGHVRTLPGIRNATLSYASPMLTMSDCVAPDRGTGFSQPISAGANIVGSNYFSTFGIPLIRGREFTSADTSSEHPVLIVNETLARRYWPGQDPIGNRIRVGDGCEKGQGTTAEIVGIAKDAQYAALGPAVQPYIFYPFEQHFVRYVALVIQTDNNPVGLASVLRRELRGVDSRLRIYDVDTLSDQIGKSLWQTRWEASLLSGFGVLALLIAAVGLYGVIAYAARQRTREFGIRMALGAQGRDVLRLVTSDALAITLAGVAVGLAISLATTNLLRGFLYGLSPTDVATYTVAALLWTVVSLVASCVPACRATRVDPAVTLREE
ncbi:MAG: ABC transporter permease [Candidatus Sulfotelmatobacter sp.]